MTIEQLEKKKAACKETISKVTKEIEKLDQQIKETAQEEIDNTRKKYDISWPDFAKIRFASKEKFRAFIDSLPDGKETKDETEEKP